MFTQTTGNRDFHWMNAYLMSAMMRDPYQDWKPLRDEFMDAYYGDAAKPLREFMAVVQKSVVDGNHHLHYKEGTVKSFFSPTVIEAGERLFAEAASAVGEDAERLARVREERMHFLCTKLQHACRDSVLNACSVENGRYVFGRSEQMDREVTEFATWRSERFGGGSGSCMMHVETDLVTLDNGSLELEFLPRLAGRMVGLHHKASGHNFMHMAPCENGSFNLENGYREEWLHAPCVCEQESTSSWSVDSGDSAGAAEAGAGLPGTDDGVVYGQLFETGGKYMHPLQWERWTRLAKDRPQFQIESMIVNRGIDMINSAVETCLPLDLGDVADVMTSERGTGFPARSRHGSEDPCHEGPVPLSPSTRLSPEDAARGIVLSNPKLGVALTWRATGEVIREVRIRAEAQRILIQIETQPLVLTPGAGRRFVQEIEVLA